MILLGTVLAFISIFGIALGCQFVFQHLRSRRVKHGLLSAKVNSMLVGREQNGNRVYLPLNCRLMHAQVIGTTNAGKTESVIVPWAVDDIQNGRGLLLVDGKADRSLLDKLYAYCVKFNRQDDFKLFSLQSIEESDSYNPLTGGSPEEITERLFNAFEFENSYYRSIQFEVLSQIMRIISQSNNKSTMLLVLALLKSPDEVMRLATTTKDSELIRWAAGFMSLTINQRDEKTSGLTSQLSHFCFGGVRNIFNQSDPDIDFSKVLSTNQIVYFQLPVLRSPFLGRATGKLVLQNLQWAIANRHSSGSTPSFFSVYLDDFSEYLYPGFVSILNKSRSANIGITFAHQSLGDIQSLGDDVATAILTNSNLKVIMRNNDPVTAEYFAKVIGTQQNTSVTERQKKSIFGNSKTGDGSIREVEQFRVHPNVIKNQLGLGQGLMIVPHERGTETVLVNFNKLSDLTPVPRVRPKIPDAHDLKAINQKEKEANLCNKRLANLQPPQ